MVIVVSCFCLRGHKLSKMSNKTEEKGRADNFFSEGRFQYFYKIFF